MKLPRLAIGVVLAALASWPLGAQERLDLDLAPDAVETPAPQSRSPELSGGERSPFEAEPPPPGWRVRPEVDLEVRGGEDGTDLDRLDLEVDSFGLRLQRTW